VSAYAACVVSAAMFVFHALSCLARALCLDCLQSCLNQFELWLECSCFASLKRPDCWFTTAIQKSLCVCFLWVHLAICLPSLAGNSLPLPFPVVLQLIANKCEFLMMILDLAELGCGQCFWLSYQLTLKQVDSEACVLSQSFRTEAFSYPVQ
jgi:hypothetical protein